MQPPPCGSPSTPVGQLRTAPAGQAEVRHLVHPQGSARPATSVPSSASCSTRERPGGVLLLPGRGRTGTSRRGPRGDAPCRRRCSGAPRRRAGIAGAVAPAAGPRRAVAGRRCCRVEQVPRVAHRLDRGEEGERLLVVHQRQQLERARPSPCSRRASPVLAELDRAGGEELPEDARGRRTGSRCARARTCRRSARRGRRRGRALQQPVEVAQPGAEPLRRHRRVLHPSTPARQRPGRRARRRPRGSARGGAAGPSRPPGGRAHRPSRPPAARARRRRPRRRATRTTGRSGTAPPRARTRSTIRASRPLAGDHPAAGRRDQGGYGVGGVHHRGIAEHHQLPLDDVVDQAHRRLAHQRERALRADEEPVERATVLPQQVLERVAADLARTVRSRCGRGRGAGRPALPAAPPPRWPRATSSATTLSTVRPWPSAREPHALLPIIPPIVQRVWVDGPVRTAARAGGRPLQVRVHDTRLNDGRAGLGSIPSTRFQVSDGVHDDPVPTALPAIDVPAPRIVTGTRSPEATSRTASNSSACRGRHDLRTTR